MIQALVSVGLVAGSALAVATFPRSVLVFLLFQGSLLFVYRARIPERLRWALLAAALLVLLPVLANNSPKPINLTNGPKPITPIARPPTPFGLPYGEYFYFLALLIVVAVVIVNRRLEDSHIGRAWEAIREDELAARAMGVPLVRMKLMAFACGASFAGVMGVLFSAKQVFINPDSFTFLESIGVLAMVILGGMGSIPGAIVGATVVTVLNLQVLKGFSLWLNEL